MWKDRGSTSTPSSATIRAEKSQQLSVRIIYSRIKLALLSLGSAPEYTPDTPLPKHAGPYADGGISAIPPVGNIPYYTTFLRNDKVADS